MPPAAAVAAITVLASLLMMGGEAILSSFNERQLRARGAIEPAGDVINAMRFAYPGAFLAMGIEGALSGPASKDIMVAGLALFGLAKALKIWAISSLGGRWSYRVLILPGAPLVTTGPYRFLSHPNYVAVVGELLGATLMCGAVLAGPAATAFFLVLILKRIAVENRAVAAHLHS